MLLILGDIEPNEATIDRDDERRDPSGVLPVCTKVHDADD
jgi:hypothetical protein